MSQFPRDFDSVLDLARKKGWTSKIQGNGHLLWTSPEGKTVVTSSTPSDAYYAGRKIAKLFRRAGLMVEDDKVVYTSPPTPETPRTVIDRSVLPEPDKRDFLVPKIKRVERGAVKKAVLSAIAKLGEKRTFDANDIFTRVAAVQPQVSISQLRTYMKRFSETGVLVEVKDGAYSLPAPDAVAPPRKKKVLPDHTSPIDDDSAVLENALLALAAIEGVVRKHQKIAQQFAGLQSMIATLNVPSVVPTPAPEVTDG